MAITGALILAACTSGGDPSVTPASTVGATFAPAAWEYAGYQVEAGTVTVFARLPGPADLDATLEGANPVRIQGGDSAGLMTFEFRNIAPGRHELRLADRLGNSYSQGAWVTQANPRVMPYREKFKMLPGDAFRVQGGDLVIAYTGTYGDSRCPVDVTCIQAGSTAHQFTAYKPGAAVTETIITAPNGAQGGELIAGKYLVTVSAVSPEARSNVQPDFSKYELEVSYLEQGVE